MSRCRTCFFVSVGFFIVSVSYLLNPNSIDQSRKSTTE
jgi:hypothetical protein